MQNLPWIIALAAVALLASMVTVLIARARAGRDKPPPLPSEWALSPRPVFSTDERRVYKLLREALPHHVLLAKLPLVRLCQPSESNEVRYWYDLLGPIHVTFAICSTNGRVLAAIDLDNERGTPRRAQQIKQSVLAACRVRYLRCPVDNLPSVAELQLLVPQSGLAARGPMQASLHPLRQAGPSLPTPATASRRTKRTALWHDSSQFQDSFFGPDNRADSLGNSEFAALTQQPPAGMGRQPREDESPRYGASQRDDLGGVIVDEVIDFASASTRR